MNIHANCSFQKGLIQAVLQFDTRLLTNQAVKVMHTSAQSQHEYYESNSELSKQQKNLQDGFKIF